MKRTGMQRLGDEPGPLPPQQVPAQIQQAGASNMHTLAQSAQPQIIGATTMVSVGSGGFRGARSGGAAVINYLKPAQYQSPKPAPHHPLPPRLKFQHQQQTLPTMPSPMERQSPVPQGPPGPPGPPVPPGGPPGAQFQRLKVEDALSYLDQVKFKFNTQPQVYNDFLDIMKEFKSQTIDTPGVITRVSNLFKGHPELIVGFNTFLPPGYKIEVQSNGQVSVSMPSPTGLGGGLVVGVHHAPPQPLVHILPVAQSVPSAIVHNLSVNATPANTLHHISQAHQQIEAAAIHHQPGSGAAHTPAAPPGQPVEFNHAIEYVNKIKSRFSRQPDKYKRFLEILHAYQRGHRDLKEPQAKQQTEQEVYAQVAKLFENQEDLLAEFGQFLPDAKAVTKPTTFPPHPRTPPLLPPPQRVESEERYLSSGATPPPAAPHHAPHHAPPAPHTPLHHHQVPKHSTSSASAAGPHHLKRSPSFSSATHLLGAPAAKKCRSSSGRDVSYAEAAKLATPTEFNFFDKARKALRSQHVYDNFLRCLLLFTNEIISSSELVMVTAPFLCRHPELHKWLADFLGPPAHHPPPPPPPPEHHHDGYNNLSTNSLLSYDRERSDRERDRGGDRERTDREVAAAGVRYEPLGALGAQMRHDRPQGDAAMDIDLSTCKRLGTSYCALPREATRRACSGRTALCREVLNDTWVSFPTWSEDSTFVTSRKTQYEEYIYRCEDERFELDVVIETNASTIRVLESVQKKLSRMSPEEASRFRLDDCLGGHSPTIHQRALRRIYGDKAVDIIAGLKKNPFVAVPVVLRRLKAKEEEWREAQKGFNKQWREQNEKYYLKSLDHQGINFKQSDLKAMRSKSLFNEVEAAYAARRPGPHLVLDYELKGRSEAIKIVRDAAELLIHHARRQSGIQNAEKRRIKQLLRHFLPDLFAHPRQPLSDDEGDDEEKDEVESPESPGADADKDADKDTKPPANVAAVKQEKQESSESDGASDKVSRNHKNDKENKPKNNNNSTNTSKESTNAVINNVKRPSEEQGGVKTEIKTDQEVEEDFRDHPPNEARFVCTSSWYLFLRLHGAVCQRLGAARRAALLLQTQEDAAKLKRPPEVAAALRLKPSNLPGDASSPAEYYNILLELVKGVLDGNTEPSAFEDAAREMFGIRAYPAFTLDKLVSIAVRQLQHCVSEPWSARCVAAAQRGMRGPPGYVRRAAAALRHAHTAFLVKVYGGDECKVTFEMLEGAGEGRTSPQNNDNSRLSPTNQSRPSATNGETVSRVAAWSAYAERFARPDIVQATPNKPVFLRRAARRCGGQASNVAGTAAAPGSVAHARRKPPRIHDAAECTIANTLRLLASRPHQLYRPGCLAAARASHSRLQAARRERFQRWLERARPPHT